MKLSFEVFPPKISDGIEHIYGCLDALSAHSPEFISVTYSAGNAGKGLTAEVCEKIKNTYLIKSVSHLTCAGTTKEGLQKELWILKNCGVDTILALRGDLTEMKKLSEFMHATDIMEEINRFGGFELFGACYPEGHMESENFEEDINVLKMKYDMGVKKFLSQLFFDNGDFMRMCDEADKKGIKAEFCAGIMPVLSAKSAIRMVELSGASFTKEMKTLIDKYEKDNASMKKAGIEYAIKQIRDLCERGYDAIHLYTMDNAEVTDEICRGIKDLR